MDELTNDPIFSELRAFAATPVSAEPTAISDALAELQKAPLGGKAFLKKWLRRIGIPTLAVCIGVPSLSYAGLLPHQISQNVKKIVHTIGKVVTSPLTIDAPQAPAQQRPAVTSGEDGGRPHPEISSDSSELLNQEEEHSKSPRPSISTNGEGENEEKSTKPSPRPSISGASGSDSEEGDNEDSQNNDEGE